MLVSKFLRKSSSVLFIHESTKSGILNSLFSGLFICLRDSSRILDGPLGPLYSVSLRSSSIKAKLSWESLIQLLALKSLYLCLMFRFVLEYKTVYLFCVELFTVFERLVYGELLPSLLFNKFKEAYCWLLGSDPYCSLLACLGVCGWGMTCY